jgi:hypothetical protein
VPFEQDVKELAYTIDPPCWVSYSGKGRNFKAAMEFRRKRALDDAQGQIDQVKERRMARRQIKSLMGADDPDQNFMVEITTAEGTRKVEYTDDINIGEDIARWAAENHRATIKIIPN